MKRFLCLNLKDLSNPLFPSHVCRLEKAIYGLKQAPQAWYTALHDHLQKMGFIKSESDTSLFILKNLAATVYVLVYVDDVLIIGSHPSLNKQVIDSLGSRFSLKALGNLNYFLGVEAKKVPDGLILSELDMQNCKGVSTPMCSGKLLWATDGSPPANATLYRRTLSKL